jgi:hypothetical protein
MAKRTDLLKGTLDLLILKILDLQARHGAGVAERMEQITAGTFKVKPGSLFPAQHRLKESGCIQGEWTASDEGRRIKSLPADRGGSPATGGGEASVGADRARRHADSGSELKNEGASVSSVPL